MSRAKAECGLGNNEQAAAFARAARDHFEKLRMKKEWEEADVLLHQVTDSSS
jgi:hypothetical protein